MGYPSVLYYALWPGLYLLAIGPTTYRQLSAMGAFLDKSIWCMTEM